MYLVFGSDLARISAEQFVQHVDNLHHFITGECVEYLLAVTPRLHELRFAEFSQLLGQVRLADADTLLKLTNSEFCFMQFAQNT